MTKLSSSLLFEAKAKVRPLMNVSIALASPEKAACHWRTMKLKLKVKSSSLSRRTRKAGSGDAGEDSGS